MDRLFDRNKLGMPSKIMVGNHTNKFEKNIYNDLVLEQSLSKTLRQAK